MWVDKQLVISWVLLCGPMNIFRAPQLLQVEESFNYKHRSFPRYPIAHTIPKSQLLVQFKIKIGFLDPSLRKEGRKEEEEEWRRTDSKYTGNSVMKSRPMDMVGHKRPRSGTTISVQKIKPVWPKMVQCLIWPLQQIGPILLFLELRLSSLFSCLQSLWFRAPSFAWRLTFLSDP